MSSPNFNLPGCGASQSFDPYLAAALNSSNLAAMLAGMISQQVGDELMANLNTPVGDFNSLNSTHPFDLPPTGDGTWTGTSVPQMPQATTQLHTSTGYLQQPALAVQQPFFGQQLIPPQSLGAHQQLHPPYQLAPQAATAANVPQVFDTSFGNSQQVPAQQNLFDQHLLSTSQQLLDIGQTFVEQQRFDLQQMFAQEQMPVLEQQMLAKQHSPNQGVASAQDDTAPHQPSYSPQDTPQATTQVAPIAAQGVTPTAASDPEVTKRRITAVSLFQANVLYNPNFKNSADMANWAELVARFKANPERPLPSVEQFASWDKAICVLSIPDFIAYHRQQIETARKAGKVLPPVPEWVANFAFGGPEPEREELKELVSSESVARRAIKKSTGKAKSAGAGSRGKRVTPYPVDAKNPKDHRPARSSRLNE
ncbi:hypothetical protein FRC12_013980 [Ceratobasidium sp. 428]|nr:hypothetical protein FRC12_013980 [Ceratobasidium sp. 428]